MFSEILMELKERTGTEFSLETTIHNAEMFMDCTKTLHRIVSGLTLTDAEKSRTDIINRTMMRLSRIIVPIVQTAVSPFDHDLALPIKRLPTLQHAPDLADMDDASDDARFLRTRLVRERNRIDHALLEAKDVVDDALKKLGVKS